ncbi:MAG: (2E,6E)-farnesyl diphosphate synthase [Gammaproteobacteria bacterium]|nr:(2E,6E)-farnesyl diphosphate synthase [Gammaproteobacteria bacterium]MCY4282944.1 (2E,6E)-farnesyl diphosphate synthase [Gammaproteobacteria bacterium]MCY4337832.1 (2E,6E)-farnesyl diphosphate synthase [Gammaproteobacteria bacterium]
MTFTEKLSDCQSRVNATLERWIPASTVAPASLHEAIRYAIFAGGKRIRPVLVYAGGEAFKVEAAALDACACAVEMIHTYSLIHDDLPAMDDDDLRRGRPTCHKAYGEATAILAGDALQALAFQALAQDTAIPVPPAQRLQMIGVLAHAAGSLGMAGGQAIDLGAENRMLALEELQTMHAYKTGALIRASVELGALCSAPVDEQRFARVSRYAQCIGLAFQIHDDVLDIESDTETLGKPQGSDLERNKATYPSLLGLEGAKRAARQALDEALENLADFGAEAGTLRELARYIVEREH